MTIANMMCGLKTQSNSGFRATNNWSSIVVNVLRNGTCASRFMSKLDAPGLVLASFLVTGSLFSSLSSAQEPTLDSRIQSATEALASLDQQAKTCLDQLELGDTDQAVSSCDSFLQSIDGSLLADYLAHCDVLKSWREDFVTGEIASTENAEENLELMRGIELACGEGALQKRTEFVVSAFNLLQGNPSQSQATSAVNRRIAELEFEQTLNAERRLLQDGILQQRQRTNSLIERQWDDQQEELIRQEINRPPFPGN